jgi:hypothetical protein
MKATSVIRGTTLGCGHLTKAYAVARIRDKRYYRCPLGCGLQERRIVRKPRPTQAQLAMDALELITGRDRQRLIAEGRFWSEYEKAQRELLIALGPVNKTTVTWFSPRISGPTMREWNEEDDDAAA